ncbi:MAG: hypothetical protein AB7D35_05320 [Bacteroidales bacterium]
MSELESGLKNLFLGGVGAVALTAERTKVVTDQLITKGEQAVKEGKVFNEELKRDISDRVKEAVDAIAAKESVEKIVNRMEQMTPDELEQIRLKLAEIEQLKKESDETSTDIEANNNASYDNDKGKDSDSMIL